MTEDRRRRSDRCAGSWTGLTALFRPQYRTVVEHLQCSCRTRSAAWQDSGVAVLADIVIDCRHPASLARFWAQVLDDYEIAPYDGEEIARLTVLGITDVEDDPTVLVEAPVGPRLWFQAVPETKSVKNRVHLDVRAAQRHQEVQRLVVLGATVVDERPDLNLTVLQDPEGNEFCVIE
jgi:hypothetical protein